MLFKKNKIETTVVEEAGYAAMEKAILVLGMGCKKCEVLRENIKEALQTMGIDEEVYAIHDIALISSFGVMSTPALVIDRQVQSTGRLLSVKECVEMLQKFRGIKE